MMKGVAVPPRDRHDPRGLLTPFSRPPTSWRWIEHCAGLVPRLQGDAADAPSFRVFAPEFVRDTAARVNLAFAKLFQQPGSSAFCIRADYLRFGGALANLRAGELNAFFRCLGNGFESSHRRFNASFTAGQRVVGTWNALRGALASLSRFDTKVLAASAACASANCVWLRFGQKRSGRARRGRSSWPSQPFLRVVWRAAERDSRGAFDRSQRVQVSSGSGGEFVGSVHAEGRSLVL